MDSDELTDLFKVTALTDLELLLPLTTRQQVQAL